MTSTQPFWPSLCVNTVDTDTLLMQQARCDWNVVSIQAFDGVAVARAPVGEEKEIPPKGQGDAHPKVRNELEWTVDAQLQALGP